ncbi:hypothetical protein BJX68DRAFT_267593 [Aspergillus pseudodeflectus]|uniref:Xylanolytic transcriptional activator regulatory domain-containing protein n=1 Tax=Aspergillus pseudodeflectus TaxID=176178 RepID=A0ABR4K8X2_9EURO
MRSRRSSCTYVPVSYNRAVVRYVQTIDFNTTDVTTSSSGSDFSAQHMQEPDPSVQALTDRVRQLEHVLEEFLGLPDCSVTPQDPAIHGRFLKNRFFGFSHRSNICESKFRNLLVLLYQFNADEASEIRILHEQCHRLARTIKMQISPVPGTLPNLRDLVPSKSVADILVAGYLRTFESVYRIIHRPSFLRRYDQFWGCPLASQVFIVKLLLMLAIGSVFEPGHVSRPAVAQWLYVAQQWLDLPAEQPRLDLDAIQVQCLLLIARQATTLDAENMWIRTGNLLNAAMHMGLHLDPGHLVQPSPFQAEMRRRLWATVLELIIQTSMDAGAVPQISLDDYDCAPPRNLSDDRIERETLPPCDPQGLTETSIQVALLRSLPLRLQIARIINNFRDGPSYEETLRLSSELSDLYREAAHIMYPQANPTPNNQPTTFQRRLYDLMTQRFILVLHDPFSMQAKTKPTYTPSRKFALKTSLHILLPSPPQIPISSIEPTNCDYVSLCLSGTSSFRDIPMQAAAVLFDELLTQITRDNAVRPSSRSTIPKANNISNNETYDNLRNPLDAFLTSNLARLKIAETNVKPYVIFQCILAQANALQAGRNVNDAIHEALRDSLVTSVSILEAVAAPGNSSPVDGCSSVVRDEPAIPVAVPENEVAGEWVLGDEFAGDFDSWLVGCN